MSVTIPSRIVDLPGQCVKAIRQDELSDSVIISCRRDRRRSAVDHRTGQRGWINRLLHRRVQDLPLFGQRCYLDIEVAEVFLDKKTAV
jgi:hypothetical protein